MAITKVDFDPDKKIIKDIFDGSVLMSIPRYQRTYAWSKDKVEEFYDDFIVESEKPEDNLAYLGTILFSKDINGNLEVIDGQQRLVTITIFFAAIRDLAKYFIGTIKSNSYSDAINKLIVPEAALGNFILEESSSIVKLKVGADIEDLFDRIIYHSIKDAHKLSSSRKVAERNVINAYNLFYNKIKTMIDHPKLSSDDQLKMLVRLVQKVLEIEYIDIRVVDKEVAYNLFESHNAKGVALAKTDLIKNYYFGRIKATEDEKTQIMNEWDSLLDELDAKTSYMLPDRFFNYLVESFEGQFSSSYLYRKIKPYIENPSDFRKLLKDNIKYIIELKSASTGDIIIDNSLAGIEKMKVNQCFIYLLCLRRNKDYFTNKHYQYIVKMIENFSYIYSYISKQPTNALEKVYAKYAKKIQNQVRELGKYSSLNQIDKERFGGRALHDLREEMIELLPSRSVFASGMDGLRYDNRGQKSIIKYTFERIEYHHSKGLVNLGDRFTLDHIVPQSKSNGQNKFNSIGNLVPLSSTDNSSLGAKSPHEKMETYKNNSQLYSVDILIKLLESCDNFGPEEIEQRADLIADYAYSHVFKIN